MIEPNIRYATVKDVAFIIHAIIESEKSNSTIVPSAQLFGINEDEYSDILQKMLESGTHGTEFSLSAYILAETNDEVLSTACAWVEGDGDSRISTSKVKTELIRNTLSIAQIMNLKKNMKVAREMQLPRTPGTLQLESFYTKVSARGQRLIPQILEKHIQDAKAKHPDVSIAEIQVFGNNSSSIKACESLGFKKTSSTKSNHPEILKFYGWNEKLLLSKNI